jgi:hypothetical protein
MGPVPALPSGLRNLRDYGVPQHPAAASLCKLILLSVRAKNRDFVPHQLKQNVAMHNFKLAARSGPDK